MSQLYYSEQGHVIPSLCEELTDYRRARKALTLPSTREPANLFVLARSYPGNTLPLRVAVNGVEQPSLRPIQPDIYFWYEMALPPTLLKAGENVFEFWTDAPAMNAWSLGLENGHKDPRSFVSTDGGRTWRNEKLGYHNMGFGEYVVRVRLAEGRDPAPPALAWENRDHPRLRRLGELLPDEAWGDGTTHTRVRSLLTWASTSWYYRNTGAATQYAPWDPETILAWGKAARGHNGREPVVMCVQYAVTLVMSCLAVGIPARPAVFTGAINGFNGHFTGEVWFKEFNKWVMVDPTLDAMLFKGDEPLSVTEIQQAGDDLTRFIRFGPGQQYQTQNPVIESWIPDNLAKGVCFRHRSLWPRTDFLSQPELTPPGHGETAYSETDLVWETKDLAQGFGMFPYFGDSSYFDAPPQGFEA
jgi:hypothetical protein